MHCETVLSGEDGIARLKNGITEGTPFNLVFLDWKLPGENTTRIVGEIQEIVGASVPIVIISVADWIDIEDKVKPLHISQFLTKPIMPSTLYNTVISLSAYKGILEQEETAEEDLDLTGKLAGKVILVAEDIEINQEILASILENTQVSLEFANNGIVAVEMFKKKKYDLVLMDVQMPELDGLNATRQIRSMWMPFYTPIVAMTANAFNEDVEACLKAGMNGHLSKPIDVVELMATLAKYLLNTEKK
jgi:CheY-like chemotaxis protein